MKYFITIYIDPMKANILHIFLGFTNKHFNELDSNPRGYREIEINLGHIIRIYI